MSDDERLEINTLDRFRKQSDRLILEQHSHCEVPAGCGGVVLRWVRPDQVLMALVWHVTAEETTLFIDGREPPSTRISLDVGDHVVGAHLEDLPARSALILALSSEARVLGGVSRTGPQPEAQTFCTLPDGTWRYTLEEPEDESWLRPGFNDSDWTPMEPSSLQQPERGERGYWSWERAAATGATALGISKARKNLWVRKEIHIEAIADPRGEDEE